MKKSVWILEDDTDLGLIYSELLNSDFEVLIIKTLKELEQTMAANPKPSLLVADLTLPDGSFLPFYKKNKNSALGQYNVVVISNIDDTESLQEAFQLGVSEYLTKPFNTKEFVVKLNRIINRTSDALKADGPIILDQKNIALTIHSTNIPLTPKEFKIINTLLDRPQYLVEKKDLYQNIWGITEDGFSKLKTLEVHISNLRKKIQPHGYDVAFVDPDSFQLKETKKQNI